MVSPEAIDENPMIGTTGEIAVVTGVHVAEVAIAEAEVVDATEIVVRGVPPVAMMEVVDDLVRHADARLLTNVK